ncbi:MAG: DUF1599 domain-containing protein [Bacteroidia bacterium]|nr:DUF1599 domain-containing protein [Bacteroidia bacterium]
MKQTNQQYQAVINECRALFINKARDYGTSWRILRMPSITDQIFIKAERIRSLQETKVNMVGDSVEGEFIGIINYCVIALMLLDFQHESEEKIVTTLNTLELLSKLYDSKVEYSYSTMLKKNHDYGEAWRKMRISSMTDLILMKIYRLKQIEDNEGKLLASEGPDANYVDILNYAVFCLIKIGEEKPPHSKHEQPK